MRVSVVEMSGHSSSVAALLAMMVMMMAMLITHTHGFSINQTITVSYSASCDGLKDDLSCLVGQTDLDSDEFMLDSEFSRRILVNTVHFTDGSSNPGHSVACDRSGHPPKPCHTPNANRNPKQQCSEQTNRECNRYP